jgi:HD-GYP domain-containing protein (c-di-GMP phosphodiesterase class II)
MDWEPSALIPLLALLLYGVLFLVVTLSRSLTQIQERRVFREYLLAMLIWSVSAFLVLIGIGEVAFEFRVMLVAALGSMVALFRFVQTALNRRWRWAAWVYLYAIIAITISMFTNWVVASASVQAGVLNYEFGPQVALIAGPGYILYVFSLIQLMRGYQKSEDLNQRNRLRYLIAGLGIVIVSSVVNFTPLGRYPIDIAGNGFNALLIAFAILRHNLLDIRVVIRKSLLYSIPTVLIGMGYFLVISLALRLFDLSSGLGIFILSLIVAFLTALVAQPLRDRAQSWIDRIFYREKYDADLMLQRLSQTTTSLLDIEKITRLILSEINNTMHIEHGAILIKYSEDGNFQVIAEDGDTKHFPSGIRGDHPIVNWMTKHNEPLINHELSIGPIFKSLWKEEKEELEKFNAELFLPLHSKGELIGILVLGKKLSSQQFTQDEQLILSTLANQTAVTIENARLYDELRWSFVQSVTALANAIDIRDTYTNTHSQQIATWAAKIARLMGCTLEEINEIYLGGLLHDIGKIGIPDAILQKPAKLDDAEWKIVHTHPKLGAELISPIKKLASVSPMIENSHERYDGLGYPNGKKAEEIPLGARIISVVDSYSAMLDKRPYKEPYSRDKVIEELKQNSGKMYDPTVIEVFLKIIQVEDKETSPSI